MAGFEALADSLEVRHVADPYVGFIAAYVVRDEATAEPNFDIVCLHHYFNSLPHMAMWSTIAHSMDISNAIGAYTAA
jgi:hypothetical protein